MRRREPTPKSRKLRLGSTLLEFTLLGIPVIFLFTSVITASIDMWQFFTLSYATGETARYISMHGATCASPNSCTITQSQIATYFEGQALALNAAATTLTLDDGSGAITCSPVTSCPSKTAVFPTSGNNAVGTNSVTVTATYALTNPIAMFWPGTAGMAAGSFTVGAKSTQGILF